MDNNIAIATTCPIAVPVFTRLRFFGGMRRPNSGGALKGRSVPITRRTCASPHDTR